VEKYCSDGQATNDNMAHAHCILDTYGSKVTFRICNKHCLCRAQMAARTHLSCRIFVFVSLWFVRLCLSLQLSDCLHSV